LSIVQAVMKSEPYPFSFSQCFGFDFIKYRTDPDLNSDPQIEIQEFLIRIFLWTKDGEKNWKFVDTVSLKFKYVTDIVCAIMVNLLTF